MKSRGQDLVEINRRGPFKHQINRKRPTNTVLTQMLNG